MLRLSNEVIYKGCEKCLVTAAIYRVRVSTYSLALRVRRFCELNCFKSAVIEITRNC